MYNLNLGLFLLECFQIILPSKAPWDTPSVPIRHKDQKIIFLLCVSSNKLIGVKEIKDYLNLSILKDISGTNEGVGLFHDETINYIHFISPNQ